jgi:hypothetical protein
MEYYKLTIDLQDHEAWHLGDIARGDLSPGDNWRFVQPPMIPMDNSLRENAEGPYKTRLKNSGKPVDYTIAGYAGVPIVKFKVTRCLQGMDGFTAFPVDIEGFAQRDLYHILHFWDVVDCVDEGKSDFAKFAENDPVRPDLAGQYSGFYKLIVDPSRAEGKHIFRLARSLSDIIVSEEVKRRFEDAGVTGAVFESVNGDGQTVA